MKKYEPLEMTVIKLPENDVLTTSGDKALSDVYSPDDWTN